MLTIMGRKGIPEAHEHNLVQLCRKLCCAIISSSGMRLCECRRVTLTPMGGPSRRQACTPTCHSKHAGDWARDDDGDADDVQSTTAYCQSMTWSPSVEAAIAIRSMP